jgi:hypothetical protein
MDYPVSGSAPNTADAVVLHTISGGVAVPMGPTTEVVVAPTVSSGATYSSGVCIGGAIALSGGFVSGTNAASLRHLSIDLAVSTAQNITATILRGAVTSASTVIDHTVTSIGAADAGKVIGQEVLTPLQAPGNAATVYRQTGLDYVVPAGGTIVLTAGGAITMPSASGLTVGAGLV